MRFTLLIGLIFYSLSSNSQIYINEVMPSNNNYLEDATNNYPDWIELYNDSDEAIDLVGYKISKIKSLKAAYTISNNEKPLIIEPKSFLIFFSSEQKREGNYFPFNLSARNERIYLYSPNNKILDSFLYKDLKPNVSIGRENDGKSKKRFFANPTPAQSNSSSIAYKGYTKAPKLNKSGGFFEKPIDVKIKKRSLWKTQIYYTLDSSEPDSTKLNGLTFNYKNRYRENINDPQQNTFLKGKIQTFKYGNQKIKIENTEGKKNITSMKSSTFSRNPNYLPNYEVDKAQILRARAIRKNYLPSDIVTQTYFTNPKTHNKYTLPLLSVNLNEDDLFDYQKGIYTAGKIFDDFRAKSSEPASLCTIGNFSQRGNKHEKQANFEFFVNKKCILNEYLDLRIHGGCTRSFSYKSLRLHSRNDFKKTDFFEQNSFNHKSLIIRNGGNDHNKNMFKDIFIHQWFKDLNFPIQEARPSILFLNGEYWGIHNLRERIDNNFLQRKFKVNPKHVDMVEIVFYGPPIISHGDDQAFKKLMAFFQQNDLRDEKNYSKAKELLDLENFIDYQIANIFIGNIDWPQNNVRLWRLNTERTAASSQYGHDGKWRFIFFDAERSLGELLNAKSNDLALALSKPENLFLQKLIQNQDFKKQFLSRYNYLLTNTFISKKANAVYDSLASIYEPEVAEHIKRWKNISTVNQWKVNGNQLKNYIKDRNIEAKLHIKEVFGNTEEPHALSVNSNLENAGNFLITVKNNQNLSLINSDKQLSFFNQNDNLKIQAIPKSGYRFSHWNTNDGKKFFEDSFELQLTSDSIITAYFIPDQDSQIEQNKNSAPLAWVSNGLSLNGDLQNDEIFIELFENVKIEFFELYDKNGKQIPLKPIHTENTNTAKYTFQGKIENGTYYYILKLKNQHKPVVDFITITE